MLLDYNQFDDGSLDCRTFTFIWLINNGNEFINHYEWDDVKKFIPGAVESIIKAFKAGKHHVNWVSEDGTVEIQWD